MRSSTLIRVMLALIALLSADVLPAREILYIHTDVLGTPVAYSDEDGNIVRRVSRDPYGSLIEGVGDNGPGYTGHVSDTATGLIYAQQRYYDPSLGIFLSVDPVSPEVDPSLLFNRYRYGNGNPYTYVDPDGRMGCTGTRISSVCQSGGVAGLRTSARSPLDTGPAAQSGVPAAPGSRAVFSDRIQAQDAAEAHITWLNGGALGRFLVGQPYSIRLSPGEDGHGVGYDLVPYSQGIAPAPARIGGVISGYTRHGLNQAISRNAGRGVSATSILDAVRSPASISLSKGGATVYRGADGTKVIVSESGKVITTYGVPRVGK